MKILNEIPVDIKKGQMVSLDIEMFKQDKERLHRPHGDFACISVAVEGRDDVYQLYDTHDLKKLFLSMKQGYWVGHNMLYDLKQLIRFTPIKPRTIWDTMLVEQAMYGGYYQHFSLKDLVRRYLGVVMDKVVRDEFSEATEMTRQMKEYAAKDAVLTLQVAMTQREMHEENPGFAAYRDIDEKMIWPILDMQGVPVDVGAWTKATDEFSSTAEQLQGELGINVNSQLQVLKALKGAGIHLMDTKATTLQEYAGVPIVDQILKTRMYRKAVSTYGYKWLEKHVEADGKVYSSWHITGAETGRMSCVSGNTLLNTSRGVFRIEDYIPRDGDTILTHEGRQRPILRKIYKGKEEFVQVECSNGSMVQCTLNHRLQTPNGWVKVRDLHHSSEVSSNVNINSICDQQREYKESPAHVFGGQPKVWLSANSGQYWDEICECAVYSKQVCGRRKKGSGAEHQNVQIKDEITESHVRKTRGATSRIQGNDRGRSWLSTEESERKVSVGTSCSHGESTRTRNSTNLDGDTSHRREQTEQRTGQSCSCDGHRTSKVTYENTSITKITFVGTMDVWDIEVADDHSYVAGGLIHHNSSHPNGQNIPARKLPIFRTFFIASPGNVFIVDDVSQQEPCILAYESKDRVLTQAILSGEDLHLAVAREIFGDPKMKKDDDRRAIGKTINLGTSYGLSAHGAADRLGITLEEAEKFIGQYFNRFNGVFAWISQMRQYAFANGYIKTAGGRRVYMNLYDKQWQNNAINAPIQGGAADFTKMWKRKLWEGCQSADIPYTQCLVVHDELGSDTPKAIVRETNKIRKEAFMETAEALFKGIPMKSEFEMGRSWACKSIKEELMTEEEGWDAP